MGGTRSPLVLAAFGTAALAVMTGDYLLSGGSSEGRASERHTAARHIVAAGPSPPQRTVTQPLRDEHLKLLPHIEDIRAAANAVGTVPVPELRKKLTATYDFLTRYLVPHAQAEDKVLYAEIDRLLGNVPVTATMRRDHVEVAKLTGELGALANRLTRPPTVRTEQELRRVLYGSYTLIKLHFAKEEEVYLPILDRRLTAEQAQRLFARMEQAAKLGGDEAANTNKAGQT